MLSTLPLLITHTRIRRTHTPYKAKDNREKSDKI